MGKKAYGFSAIHAALAIVIVGIIAAVAWSVSANNSPKKSAVNTSQNPSTANQQKANVIKISELGIQFEAPESLKNLTYKVFQTNYQRIGLAPTAALSTKEIDDLESGRCSSGHFTESSVAPLGFLVKTSGTYPQNATDENSTGVLVKQFDKFYIAYRSAGTPCFSESANNEKAVSLSSDLSTALDSSIKQTTK